MTVVNTEQIEFNHQVMKLSALVATQVKQKIETLKTKVDVLNKTNKNELVVFNKLAQNLGDQAEKLSQLIDLELRTQGLTQEHIDKTSILLSNLITNRDRFDQMKQNMVENMDQSGIYNREYLQIKKEELDVKLEQLDLLPQGTESLKVVFDSLSYNDEVLELKENMTTLYTNAGLLLKHIENLATLLSDYVEPLLDAFGDLEEKQVTLVEAIENTKQVSNDWNQELDALSDKIKQLQVTKDSTTSISQDDILKAWSEAKGEGVEVKDHNLREKEEPVDITGVEHPVNTEMAEELITPSPDEQDLELEPTVEEPENNLNDEQDELEDSHHNEDQELDQKEESLQETNEEESAKKGFFSRIFNK